MRQQLDLIAACNEHDPLLGPFQYGWTSSLTPGNLTGRKTESGKDPPVIGRWSWQKFRVQGKASLRIATFYRTVSPSQGTGLGSVYSQHLIYFNNTNRIFFPKQGFLDDLKEDSDIWKKGRLNPLHGGLQ